MAAKEQDRVLISALKGKPSILNLSNRSLTTLSVLIGNIPSLQSLILKNNNLLDLPFQFKSLKKLRCLNLGNNQFSKLPDVFQYTESITHLHLFNNRITYIDPQLLCGLKHLKFLNLNHNQLTSIPSEINRLPYLEVLSLDGNQISELPNEICQLSKLIELNLNCNLLRRFPQKIAFLKDLEKLTARKNVIEEIPEGLLQCSKLKVLDVAGNNIKSFPNERNIKYHPSVGCIHPLLYRDTPELTCENLKEIMKLSLKELHCEENNLLKHLPVHSKQEIEVLTLKELAARLILAELKSSESILKRTIKHFPKLQDQLKMASTCIVCGGPFLNIWLECVQFIDSKKILHIKNHAGIIPITSYLCSYKCFNGPDHDFFGIAKAD